MLLLVVGYILIISKRFLITEKTKEKVEADSVETNKMLGLSFQQQGMLDLALEKFRKIPLEEGSRDLLYNLGLDFERKRQFSKALATYKLVIEDGQNFKDLDERMPKLKGAEATMIFGAGGGGHPGDIGATIMNMDTKPTLGRYEVSGELGRGAMGIVYKGEDPKIHRTVAIKTVRLSDFDEDMVGEMKERFFREAESAGLLTHPNIVTIYDAGDEHDLAFIAMEFLKGNDLEEYTKKGTILPVRDTLAIVAQVADALDYAHIKGIVHRDIKPANIMRLTETHEIKVTDFGIARIASSSKTKTGVILGTPSYMSPEQVAGKKVDGRSDIFSLGVVLFEMLAGEKPFAGDDMTALMYQIAKEKHPSVRSINPQVPQIVEKIIDKALEKDVEKRYQKAGQMADHLNKVVAKIDEIQEKKDKAGGN
jgi:serine/threonine-protein kinase